MTTALIIVSVLLFFSIVAHIIIGIDEDYSAQEWFALVCFIFIFPFYALIMIFMRLKEMIKEHKRKKIK